MIRFFLAKSLKLSLPITVVNDVGLFVPLVDERSGLPVGPSEAEPVNMLPEGQKLSKPAAGPPLKWVEEHGITPDCGACKSIEVSGTRKGKNHSKGCCEPFWNWTKAQAIEQAPKIAEKGPDLGIHNTKMSMNPILKNPSPMFLADWKWFLSTHLVPIGHLGMMLLTFWEWMILFPVLTQRGNPLQLNLSRLPRR